jgi:hypothetical protein
MNDLPEDVKIFYSQLNSISSFDSWELLGKIKPLNNKQNDEWQEKILIERKVLSFYLKKGDLVPKIFTVNSSGDVDSFPNSKSFNDAEIEYLKERLSVTNNCWIKSRYSHILWNITKNNKYALISLEAYLEIIKNINNDSDSESIHNLSSIIECLINITEKIKRKVELVKNAIYEIIQSSKLPYYIKPDILELILESKLFKSKEFEFTLPLLKSWVDFSDTGNYSINQSILNLAIKIAEKLNKQTNEYYENLAINQDLIIEQHKDEKDFIRLTSFGEKAKYYKQAGNIKKQEETLIEYTRLKSKYELHQIEYKIPIEETELINNYLNRKSELILKLPIESILHYFSTSDDLFIKSDVLDKMAEEGFKHSFYQFSAVNVFDINSNHKKLRDGDAKANERFKAYSIHFNLFVFPLFIKIMALGIFNGKINYHSVFKFMNDNTWFGQKFDLGNKDIENSNWLSLFAPGLYDFLSQLEWAFIMKSNNVSNYILCIDSLTLKFEGAIRDFIRLTGGTTTIEKRGELKEQLLEELLQNSMLLKHFNEDDITLFKYVFTNSGWNIRNNVAHCFYSNPDYTFAKATLVFICILKLGKYTLK